MKKKNRRSKRKKNGTEDLNKIFATHCAVQNNEPQAANNSNVCSKVEVVGKAHATKSDHAENNVEATRKVAKVF